MILDTESYKNYKIEELKSIVQTLPNKPKLVVVRVGNDEASIRYIKNKRILCEKVGIDSEEIIFDENVTEIELLEKIERLNRDKTTSSILVQLPLPKHLKEERILNAVHSKKDADGFTNDNLGKLFTNTSFVKPCTPKGIVNLLKYNGIELEGKDVLIINRSVIVGKPLAMILLNENATVTVAHSKTKNLKEKIKKADIVITGVGIPKFLKAEDFEDGTVIIDVSINFDENNKICGDIDKNDYDKLLDKSCTFTTVPGGVGPLTVLSLVDNTIELYKKFGNKTKNSLHF